MFGSLSDRLDKVAYDDGNRELNCPEPVGDPMTHRICRSFVLSATREEARELIATFETRLRPKTGHRQV